MDKLILRFYSVEGETGNAKTTESLARSLYGVCKWILRLVLLCPALICIATLVAHFMQTHFEARTQIIDGAQAVIVLLSTVFAFAVFGSVMVLALSFLREQPSTRMAQRTWLVAVGVCLFLRYVFFYRYLLDGGVPVSEEVYVPGLLIAILAFPSSLIIWINADVAPRWDIFVASLGLVQWFVIIPKVVAAVQRLTKQNR